MLQENTVLMDIMLLMKEIVEAAVGVVCFVTCAAVCLPPQFMECLEL